MGSQLVGTTPSFPNPSNSPKWEKCITSSFIHSLVKTIFNQSIHLSIYPFVRPYVCLFVRPYIRPSVHSSVRTFVHTYIRSFVHTIILFIFIFHSLTVASVKPSITRLHLKEQVIINLMMLKTLRCVYHQG